jgi:hypothetical protein
MAMGLKEQVLERLMPLPAIGADGVSSRIVVSRRGPSAWGVQFGLVHALFAPADLFAAPG